MEKAILSVQPFPFIYKGILFRGSLYNHPERCMSCTTRECLKKVEASHHICSKGVSFFQISQHSTICGIVVKTASLSKSQIKAKKDCEICSYEKFKSVISNTKSALEQAGVKVKKEKTTKIFAPTSSENKLFDIGVHFHEFKSVIAIIIKNINVIIEQHTTGDAAIEEKLDKLEGQNEKAIYYACRMLEGKLKSFEFVKNEFSIKDKLSYTKFRFHGLLHKYIQMYKASGKEKNITILNDHNSVIELFSNAEAISVVIQNLFDNAFKYAPAKTAIQLKCHENDKRIKFEISSFGPKISDKEKIFTLGYREESARSVVKEGIGFGLYTSKFICDKLGLKVFVNQENLRDKHWTTFTLEIPHHVYAENQLDLT